jgi:hypothetical protein
MWRRSERGRFMHRFAFLPTLALLLAGTAAAPAQAAGAADAQRAAGALAPHRAVYDLTLARSSGAGALSNARGRIAFEFTGSACDGYVQNFRQVTEMNPAEGDSKLSDMRSATFESGDAHEFRFKIETKTDNTRGEDIDGKARKTEAALAVDLSRPRPAHRDVAGGVFFPTEHVRRLLAAAAAGDTIVEAKVFDGSGDGQKIFDTMAVIGKAKSAPSTEKAMQNGALNAVRRWPVTLSYFEPGKQDQAPAYVLSFDLYENGVSGALVLDYGDFALKGEMTELTLSPVGNCGK